RRAALCRRPAAAALSRARARHRRTRLAAALALPRSLALPGQTRQLGRRFSFLMAQATGSSSAPPCIWKVAAGCGESVAARGPMAIGPLARRLAPAPPQATTAGELWDHRRCHARPNSRWSDARTDKAGYRDQAHLWS